MNEDVIPLLGKNLHKTNQVANRKSLFFNRTFPGITFETTEPLLLLAFDAL